MLGKRSGACCCLPAFGLQWDCATHSLALLWLKPAHFDGYCNSDDDSDPALLAHDVQEFPCDMLAAGLMCKRYPRHLQHVSWGLIRGSNNTACTTSTRWQRDKSTCSAQVDAQTSFGVSQGFAQWVTSQQSAYTNALPVSWHGRGLLAGGVMMKSRMPHAHSCTCEACWRRQWLCNCGWW